MEFQFWKIDENCTISASKRRSRCKAAHAAATSVASYLIMLKWSANFSSCITSGLSKDNFLLLLGCQSSLSLVIGEASFLRKEVLH